MDTGHKTLLNIRFIPYPQQWELYGLLNRLLQVISTDVRSNIRFVTGHKTLLNIRSISYPQQWEELGLYGLFNRISQVI